MDFPARPYEYACRNPRRELVAGAMQHHAVAQCQSGTAAFAGADQDAVCRFARPRKQRIDSGRTAAPLQQREDVAKRRSLMNEDKRATWRRHGCHEADPVRKAAVGHDAGTLSRRFKRCAAPALAVERRVRNHNMETVALWAQRFDAAQRLHKIGGQGLIMTG